MSNSREKNVIENTRRSTSSIHDLTGAHGRPIGRKESYNKVGEVESKWKAILIVICAIAAGTLGVPLILYGIQLLTHLMISR